MPFIFTLLKNLSLLSNTNTCILRLGPLVGTWCMRYEAKHHYFKHLAVVIGNFINLPFSLAKRHQESVAYRLKSTEGNLSSFIEKGIEVGPGKWQTSRLPCTSYIKIKYN